MQKHLFEHFYGNNHFGFLSDVSITFTDKIEISNPLKRKNYGKHTLKTFATSGLNIAEHV